MKQESAASQPGLVRALSPMMALAVVVGTIIGSGIFKKPQSVAEHIPYFGLVMLAWVLGGLLALLGALSLAEVAVLYPRAGGNYVFLREGYGRLAGFLWGWVEFWIMRSATIAVLANVFTESLYDLLRNQAFQVMTGFYPSEQLLGFWPQQWLTVVVILALALVNVRGVKWGGFLQLFITTVKVGSLVGILALPFLASYLVDSSRAASVPAPRPENLQPLWPETWDPSLPGRFGSALLGILWSYGGWMNIAPVAGEVRQPQRSIPFALLGGTGIVLFLYLGTNLAYSLLIPQQAMALMEDTPVATEYALRLLGPAGAAAASLAVLCSVFGALNGNILVGPRVLYAMGEDGLAPRGLGAVSLRYHTPARAILCLAAWSALLVLLAALLKNQGLSTKALFNILSDYSMFGSVIFETLAVATIFVFRRRYPDAPRPYRCWGYPLVPALYVFILFLILVNMFFHQRTEAFIGAGFIALGAAVYFLAGLHRHAAHEPSVP